MKYRKIYKKSKTKFNRTDKNVAFAATDYIYKNYAAENLTASQALSRAGGLAAVRLLEGDPAAKLGGGHPLVLGEVHITCPGTSAPRWAPPP